MSTQKFSTNADKYAAKLANLSGTGVSRQQITFYYVEGISKEKENKKTGKFETVYLERKLTKDERDKGGQSSKKLSINWQHSEKGQELLLIANGLVVASFATLTTGEISFNPVDIWDEPSNYIAIPTHTSFKVIESCDIKDFFTQWLKSREFFSHISLLSERGNYAPQLVKMTLLLLSYLIARDQVIETNMSLDVYTKNILVDKDSLVVDYLDFISMLTDDDSPAKMKKLFRNANSVLTLAPSSELPQIKPSDESIDLAVEVTEKVEAKEEIPELAVIPTVNVLVSDEVTKKVEDSTPAIDPNKAMLDRLNTSAKAKNK